MTAEHAHGIDGGGEVARSVPDLLAALQRSVDRAKAAREADETLTRATAADTVLAEARRLCCGNNPSAHHAASAKHSELMAFAGDLAQAVRQG